MLMNLFILWCVASVSLTIYGLVFCKPPLEELPSSTQETKIKPAETIPYVVEESEYTTEDTDWAA